MTRARDTRLHRLMEEAAREDVADGVERYSQRAWRRVCAIVRVELTRSGVDAARVEALLPRRASETRDFEGPDEELVLPGGDSAAEMFVAKIRDNAKRYQQSEHAPDFANASLAELFSWSLARRMDSAGCRA